MRRSLAVYLALTLLLAARITSAHAAPVTVDPDFGSGGWVTGISFPGYTPTKFSHILTYPDGRFLVTVELTGAGGNEDVGLVRFHANGMIDTTFATNGKAIIDWGSNAADRADGGLIFDQLGRIVVAGQTDFGEEPDWAMAVFTPAGFPDLSFSGNGKKVITQSTATAYISGLAIDADNNIIFTGVNGAPASSGLWNLRRVSPQGVTDNTFIFTSGSSLAPSLATDSLGRFVAGSSPFGGLQQATAVRLLPNAAPDIDFSGDGELTFPVASGTIPLWLSQKTLVQANDKIVLVGGRGKFGALRLKVDGVLDTAFGNSGFASVDVDGVAAPASEVVETAALDSQDRIFLVGTVGDDNGSEISVVRLTAGGDRDASFGSNGSEIIENPGIEDVPYDVTVMSDGDLIIVGASGDIPSMVRLDAGSDDLLKNGSFETGDPDQKSRASNWIGKSLSGDKRVCTSAHTGNCAFAFIGSVDEKSTITQTIKVPAALKAEGMALTLRAWVNGSMSIVTGKVIAIYTDGTTDAFTVQLGPSIGYTLFESAPFLMQKAARKLKVILRHFGSSGTIFLDDVSLVPNYARARSVPPAPLPSQFRSSGR